MHVSQLFHPFGGAIDVEVVIAGLPEGALTPLHRDRELHGLQCLGQHGLTWLADEQVDMLGHDDVTEEKEIVSLPHRLQGVFEELPSACVVQVGLPSVTTEGHEVEIAGVLVADEGFWHGGIVSHISARCGIPDPSSSDEGVLGLGRTHISARCGVPGFVSGDEGVLGAWENPHLCEMWGTRFCFSGRGNIRALPWN